MGKHEGREGNKGGGKRKKGRLRNVQEDFTSCLFFEGMADMTDRKRGTRAREVKSEGMQ